MSEEKQKISKVSTRNWSVIRECPLAESEPKSDPYLGNRPNRNMVKTSDSAQFCPFRPIRNKGKLCKKFVEIARELREICDGVRPTGQSEKPIHQLLQKTFQNVRHWLRSNWSSNGAVIGRPLRTCLRCLACGVHVRRRVLQPWPVRSNVSSGTCDLRASPPPQRFPALAEEELAEETPRSADTGVCRALPYFIHVLY